MKRNQQSVELVATICNHTYKSGRRCRDAVRDSGSFCSTHTRTHARTASPIVDPLVELAAELGDLTEIHELSEFLAKILKLACQNRISISRATALTFIANWLLNSLRLLKAEDRINAKDEPLEIDWTGIPRPQRESISAPPSHPIRLPHATHPA